MLASAEQEAAPQLARHKLSSVQISATMRGFIYLFTLFFLNRGVCGSGASFLGPTPETKLAFFCYPIGGSNRSDRVGNPSELFTITPLVHLVRQ